MREIKFRAQKVTTKEWVYGLLCYNSAGLPHKIEQVGFDKPYEGMFDIDPETVGQYTGLKDRNGKDIYEWDILNNGLFVGYNQLHCCFGLYNKAGYQLDLYADWITDEGKTPKEWETSDFEVIGNIYENKDLLK